MRILFRPSNPIRRPIFPAVGGSSSRKRQRVGNYAELREVKPSKSS